MHRHGLLPQCPKGSLRLPLGSNRKAPAHSWSTNVLGTESGGEVLERWFPAVQKLDCTCPAACHSKDIGEGGASRTPGAEPQEEKGCPQPRLGNGLDRASGVGPRAAWEEFFPSTGEHPLVYACMPKEAIAAPSDLQGVPGAGAQSSPFFPGPCPAKGSQLSGGVSSG